MIPKPEKPTLIVVVGPTAIGKTALGVALATHFQADVISADSRQLYKEMSIGTAKPSPEEMQGVKHHFVDSHSIHQTFTTGDFETEAGQVLDEIFKTNPIAILVGGTGMFVNALCNGMDDLPKGDEEVRVTLNTRLEQEGLEALVSQLKTLDPVYYEKVDRQNPHRIMRALEVCLITGQPYSTLLNKPKIEKPYTVIKIGLELAREQLYERIDRRMDLMLAAGLEEEARTLLPHKDLYSLQTVGYSEIFGHWAGEYDRDEMVRLLKRNSRRYAKRQLTWFKRDTGTAWFSPNDLESVIGYIEQQF